MNEAVEARGRLLQSLQALVQVLQAQGSVRGEDFASVSADVQRSVDTENVARARVENVLEGAGGRVFLDGNHVEAVEMMRGGPEVLGALLELVRKEHMKAGREACCKAFSDLVEWGVPGARQAMDLLQTPHVSHAPAKDQKASVLRLEEFEWGIRLHPLLRAAASGEPFALDKASEIPGIGDNLERLNYVVRVGTGRLPIANLSRRAEAALPAPPLEPAAPGELEPGEQPIFSLPDSNDDAGTEGLSEQVLPMVPIEETVAVQPSPAQVPVPPVVVDLAAIDDVERQRVLAVVAGEADAGKRLGLLAETRPSIPPSSLVEAEVVASMAQACFDSGDLLAAMVLRSAAEPILGNRDVPSAQMLRCFVDSEGVSADRILEASSEEIGDPGVLAATALIAATTFLRMGDYRLKEWMDALPEKHYPILSEALRYLFDLRFDLPVEVAPPEGDSEGVDPSYSRLVELLHKLEQIEPKLISPGSRVTLKRLKKEGGALLEALESHDAKREQDSLEAAAELVGTPGDADAALGDLFEALFKEGAHEQRALKDDDRKIVRTWFDRLARAIDEYIRSPSRMGTRKRKILGGQYWYETHEAQLRGEIEALGRQVPWLDKSVLGRFENAYRDRCFGGE